MLVIETKSQLFEVSGARQLVPSHRSAISGAAFVALLKGLRCERSGKFFWEIGGGRFVDSSSGALFQNKKQIPDAGPRSHAYCLLRSGDRPPLCEVPEDEFLLVFRRSGAELSIEGGRVRATELLSLIHI